ncbi:MAG: chemotaxis protein CheB [Fibrobacterales bacterium]
MMTVLEATQYKAIAIGCSKGGLSILPQILMPLPADFSIPIIIIQHLKEGGGEYLPKYLDDKCALKVREAQELAPLKKGYIYTAPSGYHLYIDSEKTFSLSVDAKVNYSRPSIDVFFESAANVFTSSLIGVLLTGANCDGAKGMVMIKNNGGLTIAQSLETAEAPAMPGSAIAEGVVDHVLTPEDITNFILKLTR